MMFPKLLVLAAAISTVAAFKDTSPFFLFSTSKLLISSPNLVSSSSLTKTVSEKLESCPSDTYIIVSQPGVSAEDFADRRSAPHLRMMMKGVDKNIGSSLAVKDVLGDMNPEELSDLVQMRCGAGHLRVDASTGSFTIADEAKPRVINLDFPAVPAGSGRVSKLVEHDAFLASVLDLLPSTRYTVIYTTSPSNAFPIPESATSESYEIDPLFQAPLHTELKRDYSSHRRASDGNLTLPDGPLFERYQFLSPGIFMGLLVTIILLWILYVAISAVSSLQITYAAFDKDMGPAAHKKQG